MRHHPISNNNYRHMPHQTIHTESGREIYLGEKTIAEQDRLRLRNRQSSLLTLTNLEQIRDSIKHFQPSESLAKIYAEREALRQESSYNNSNNNINNSNSDSNISSISSSSDNSSYNNLKHNDPPIEIDLVISGGGLKNLFMVGSAYILQQEFERHNIHIARAAGTSAGAWAAMLLLIKMDPYYWIETYHACKAAPHRGLMEIYQEPHWEEFIPEDAYLMCNGRLFVNITKWTKSGPKLWVVSEFTSNKDLVAACAASAAIPWMTQEYLVRTFRGEYVCDGGIMDNCPVFPKGLRRQLVFRLGDIEYPFKYLVRPADSCIDALVIRGALMTARFLGGEDLNGTIVWLDKFESKENLPEMNNGWFRRVVVIPITIGTLIFNNITGLFTAIFEIVEMAGYDTNIIGTVLPFDENPRVASYNGPIRFTLGLISTITINILQSFNLLV